MDDTHVGVTINEGIKFYKSKVHLMYRKPCSHVIDCSLSLANDESFLTQKILDDQASGRNFNVKLYLVISLVICH